MEMKPNILVTGSNGQLGKELKKIASSFPQFDLHFFSKEDLMTLLQKMHGDTSHLLHKANEPVENNEPAVTTRIEESTPLQFVHEIPEEEEKIHTIDQHQLLNTGHDVPTPQPVTPTELPKEIPKTDDPDDGLYAVKNFTI